MIQTRSGKLYTGITTCLERRYREHCLGKGAKFFYSDPPQKMVYHAPFPCRSSASKEEYRIKQLTRSAKLTLIRQRYPG